jgi:hypothetical protein
MHHIVDSRCVLAVRDLQASVEGVDQFHEEVSARGAEVLSRPTTDPWSLREFSIRTPDGHRIRFGEPILVALGLTSRREGRSGAAALLRGTIARPTGARRYLFAPGYMMAIKLAATALHRMVAGEWPAFGPTPVYLMAGAVIVSTPVQAGEEIGWRGYALPRMTKCIGLAPASIVVGLLWACWHLPIFFIPASDTFGQSFPRCWSRC